MRSVCQKKKIKKLASRQINTQNRITCLTCIKFYLVALTQFGDCISRAQFKFAKFFFFNSDHFWPLNSNLLSLLVWNIRKEKHNKLSRMNSMQCIQYELGEWMKAAARRNNAFFFQYPDRVMGRITQQFTCVCEIWYVTVKYPLCEYTFCLYETNFFSFNIYSFLKGNSVSIKWYGWRSLVYKTFIECLCWMELISFLKKVPTLTNKNSLKVMSRHLTLTVFSFSFAVDLQKVIKIQEIN